jgi:hypothetical protein
MKEGTKKKKKNRREKIKNRVGSLKRLAKLTIL